MKVLLINPSQYKIYNGLPAPTYFPLGLLYIAAVLEKIGSEVKIVDIDADSIQTETLKNIIKSFQPKIVGITVVTPSYKMAVHIAQTVKEVSKDIYTVLGGMHPTILPEESVRPDSVDFAVKGEGEFTTRELIQRLEDGKDIESISGLVYKRNGRIMINKNRELIDNLDLIPFPRRGLLKKQYYSYPDTESYRAIPIITSRGCPAECTFCSARQMYSRKFRARSANNVADEIEYLIRNYQPKEIHIWDDNFVTQKERVFKLRDEIRKRDIKMKFAFPNGLRADYIDEEVIKTLKEMGTYSIAFGVESGSEMILDKIKKGASTEEIRRAFRLAKKYDIETWAFFVLGLLLEDKYTIRQTIDFAKELDPDIVKFHILKPYPGTVVFEELSKCGFILDKDYENYGFHTGAVHKLADLDRGDLFYWQKRAYREFYFRPQKLLQHIFRTRSLYRFFSNLKMGLSLLHNFY